MKRNSPGMMAAGIVLVSAAPIVFFSALMSNACSYNVASETQDCGNGSTAIALTMVGIGLIGGGIPLIVIGAKKVPVTEPAPTATLSPWATPTSAGASFRLAL